MSAQTIDRTTLTSLLKEAEDGLIKNTTDLLLKKRFLLGSGYDEDCQMHNLKMYDIISKNICSLNCYIYTILKDGPEEDYEISLNIPGLIKKDDIKPADTLYQLWLNKGNIGTFTEFLDMLFNSNTDIWEESQW